MEREVDYMKKGEMTRGQIVRKSAALFNQHGYSGVSLNDIIHVTGIQKGGIYRYFSSKDEIASEAFDYAADVVFQRFVESIEGKTTCYEKLMSIFDVYAHVVESPPFAGGCPLLNTAVEHDDGHPLLLAKARGRMSELDGLIQGILRDGIQKGEMPADTPVESMASFFIATLEGGIILSRLEGDNRHMRHCAENFSLFLRQTVHGMSTS